MNLLRFATRGVLLTLALISLPTVAHAPAPRGVVRFIHPVVVIWADNTGIETLTVWERYERRLP